MGSSMLFVVLGQGCRPRQPSHVPQAIGLTGSFTGKQCQIAVFGRDLRESCGPLNTL